MTVHAFSAGERTHTHEEAPDGRRPASGGERQGAHVPRGSTHVPRTWVHKAADGEVLLQDAVRTGENRFTVAARMPRDHFLGHRGTASEGDPLLLAEAVRQTVIYLSHRFYGIPEGHAFILSALDFALDEPLPPGGPDAPPLVLEAACVAAPRGPRRLGATMEAEVHCEGRRIGRAGARWQAVDRRQYATLRLRGGGTTLLPEVASTESTAHHIPYNDAVLADVPGAEGQWQVCLDFGHPVLFDHLSDHIPGMVLLEGFRQAALLTGAGSASGSASASGGIVGGPLAAAVSFHAFGELTDPPALIVRQNGEEYAGNSATESPGSRATGREHHHFTALQSGRTIASCTVSVATPLPHGGPAC
ncbi:ScbA/BarX family gamma-butyrolactone biosynthesis protein [Streptomyces formicae]